MTYVEVHKITIKNKIGKIGKIMIYSDDNSMLDMSDMEEAYSEACTKKNMDQDKCHAYNNGRCMSACACENRTVVGVTSKGLERFKKGGE